MHAAALPGGAAQHFADGGLQPFMAVRDHQLHTLQAATHQAAQKLAPERFCLAGPRRQSQHPPLAGLAHPDGQHGGQAHDAVILAHFQVDRIKPHVRVAVFQRPLAELLDQGIQLLADPRHLALVHAGQPQALQQGLHLAGADACDIRLLHHRKERLLRPPPGFQQAWVVTALAQLRNGQLDRAHPGIPVARLSVAVALRRAVRRPLIAQSPDLLTDLLFHDQLRQQTHAFAQEVAVQIGVDLAQVLRQCHTRCCHRVASFRLVSDNLLKAHDDSFCQFAFTPLRKTSCCDVRKPITFAGIQHLTTGTGSMPDNPLVQP